MTYQDGTSGYPPPSDPYANQPPADPYQPYQPTPAQPAPYQPGPAPYPGPAAPSSPYPGPSTPSTPQPYPGPGTPAYPNQPITGQPYPSTAPTQAFPTQMYPSQVTPPASTTPYSPYGYQQYPPPTPPKSRMLPALLIGGAVVVLLVVVGVGALVVMNAPKRGGTALEPTTSASPSPTPSQKPSPTAAAFSGDLRTLLVPRPPGATKDSNEGNGNADGTVTLEQAAQTYADPAFGKTHMQDFGFKQGATESWHENGKYSVQVVLFQFDKPDNTAEFVQKLEDGGDTDDFWDDRGDVDGIPNGRFYVSAQTNKNGNYNFEIWFSKGGIAARMNAFGPNKTDVEKLKTLAKQQYALLP